MQLTKQHLGIAIVCLALGFGFQRYYAATVAKPVAPPVAQTSSAATVAPEEKKLEVAAAPKVEAVAQTPPQEPAKPPRDRSPMGVPNELQSKELRRLHPLFVYLYDATCTDGEKDLFIKRLEAYGVNITGTDKARECADSTSTWGTYSDSIKRQYLIQEKPARIPADITAIVMGKDWETFFP